MIQRITLLALAVFTLGSALEPVSGPAGVYTVTTTGPTRVTSGQGWVRIEWDAGPTLPVKPVDPPPQPVKPVEQPPPPPPPGLEAIGPLQGPVWLAAVYDKAALGSLPKGQQDLLQSKTLFGEFKALDITWSVWDKGDIDFKDWVPDAGLTYPVLLVIWDKGQKSKPISLPANEAALQAFAKQIRGQ